MINIFVLNFIFNQQHIPFFSVFFQFHLSRNYNSSMNINILNHSVSSLYTQVESVRYYCLYQSLHGISFDQA